ncbi:HAD family hydrolase [Candidatus Woesearchaeota archaeon]|nr:HAD family hydrolase [Candidatus Woesearchaeota archaeon]
MEQKKFNKDIVKHVIFDIDGTLYEKNKEYKQGKGSVQTAHDFFIFSAWHLMSNKPSQHKKIADYLIADHLVEEYGFHAKQGTLKQEIEKIPEKSKLEYLSKLKKHGSNGKTFNNEFNLNNSKFLHETMIQHIDFHSILNKDEKLQGTFDYLKNKDYNLGILTTETYKTAKDVASAMGFDLKDFHMGPGIGQLILCSKNVKNKKPSLEGFEKLINIYKPSNPSEIVYVGDHLIKDIETPLKLGIQAIHVTNKTDKIIHKTLKINNQDKNYLEIKDVYNLKEVL